jgi:ABC-type uncharacterized transport system fused permease/ATPase subunit
LNSETNEHVSCRFLYARIQNNSEEIAFYAGEKNELGLIERNFYFLNEQLNSIYLSKLWYIVVEQFLMKYVWSAAGLSMISLPLLIADMNDLNADSQISLRTEQFTTARNLLNSAADAVERILTSYKEVVLHYSCPKEYSKNQFFKIIELTGYTKRVYEMFRVFKTLENTNKPTNEQTKQQDGCDTECLSGEIIEDSANFEIVINSINVITPNGDVIVPNLSLSIRQGMNLLITGPNGCGKSSLFRIVCGLWPLHSGSIRRPSLKDLLYIPQKPYLPIGTLRDQIVYPDTLSDMRRKNISDCDLMGILGIVHLQNVVAREGGY